MESPNSALTLTRKELSLQRRDIVDAVKWYWFDSIGWRPHQGQLPLHISRARERYLTSGRRGGKTAPASKEASAYMIAGPYRVWFAGPSYDLVSMEWENLTTTLLHPANPHTIERLNSNKQAGNLYIRLSNGAEAEGRSLAQTEKSPPVGQEVDLLVLCEGARISGLGGDDGIWETQLKGNLNSRVGDMIDPTTPKGQDKWHYPRFKDGLEGINDRWALNFPAWFNIEGFLEDPVKLYREMSRRAFMQEVLGLFVSWAGSIWLQDVGFDTKVHVVKYFKPPLWWQRIEILDPGFGEWMFWIAAVVDDMGSLYIVDEFRGKGMSTDEIARMIQERRRMLYGRDENSNWQTPAHIPIYVDPEDPRLRVDLASAGKKLKEPERIACLKADNDVWRGFNAAMMRMVAGEYLVMDNCKYTISGFENHEWAGKMNAKGRQVEKRDEFKHPSDVGRYLALVPIHASKKPQESRREEFTMADLLSLEANNNTLFGSPYSKIMEAHRRAS